MTRETRETRQDSRQLPRDNGSHHRETLLASDIGGLPRASSHQGIRTSSRLSSPVDTLTQSSGAWLAWHLPTATLTPVLGAPWLPSQPVNRLGHIWAAWMLLQSVYRWSLGPLRPPGRRPASGATLPVARWHPSTSLICRPRLAIRVSLGIRCMLAGIQTFLHAWITCRSASRAIVPIKGVRWRRESAPVLVGSL